MALFSKKLATLTLWQVLFAFQNQVKLSHYRKKRNRSSIPDRHSEKTYRYLAYQKELTQDYLFSYCKKCQSATTWETLNS